MIVEIVEIADTRGIITAWLSRSWFVSVYPNERTKLEILFRKNPCFIYIIAYIDIQAVMRIRVKYWNCYRLIMAKNAIFAPMTRRSRSVDRLSINQRYSITTSTRLIQAINLCRNAYNNLMQSYACIPTNIPCLFDVLYHALYLVSPILNRIRNRKRNLSFSTTPG